LFREFATGYILDCTLQRKSEGKCNLKNNKPQPIKLDPHR